MGHSDGVNCMLMADGKIYTGGRDEYLFAVASCATGMLRSFPAN